MVLGAIVKVRLANKEKEMSAGWIIYFIFLTILTIVLSAIPSMVLIGLGWVELGCNVGTIVASAWFIINLYNGLSRVARTLVSINNTINRGHG